MATNNQNKEGKIQHEDVNDSDSVSTDSTQIYRLQFLFCTSMVKHKVYIEYTPSTFNWVQVSIEIIVYSTLIYGLYPYGSNGTINIQLQIGISYL